MSAHPARRFVWGMLLGLLSAMALATSPTIAAEGSALGLQPVDQADWFRFSVARGESIEAMFDVVNRTSETRHVRLYAVDALITPQGGFALREDKEARTGVGAWMKIERASVVAEPNSTTRVKLSLTVPNNVEPGDYAGGVVAEMDPRMGQSGDAGSKTHVQFNLIERVGIRTYLRVEGQAVRRADVISFERRGADGGSEFVVKVRNTGTLRIQPEGFLRIAGFGAGSSTVALTGPETLLPGGVGEYTASWVKQPLFAKVKASYDVRYDEASHVRGSMSFTLIAWHVVAVALAVLLIVGFAVRQAVRFVRRARRALRLIEASDGPADHVALLSDEYPADDFELGYAEDSVHSDQHVPVPLDYVVPDDYAVSDEYVVPHAYVLADEYVASSHDDPQLPGGDTVNGDPQERAS